MRHLQRAMWAAISLSLVSCSPKDNSIECWLPTYDVPDYDLVPIEAEHLASMCTENWAKFWAVRSKEAAGDIADAVTSKCSSTYYKQAHAKWPIEEWGLNVASGEIPKITAEYRMSAVAQVISTRVSGCRSLLYLEKTRWLPKQGK